MRRLKQPTTSAKIQNIINFGTEANKLRLVVKSKKNIATIIHAGQAAGENTRSPRRPRGDKIK